jgi:hypothetical protein
VEIWPGHWSLALVHDNCGYCIEGQGEMVGIEGDRSICFGAWVCVQLTFFLELDLVLMCSKHIVLHLASHRFANKWVEARLLC